MRHAVGIAAVGCCVLAAAHAVAGPPVGRGGRPSERPDAMAPVDFFRRWTPGAAQQSRVAQLVKALDSASFKEREKATADLLAEGPSAVPLLRLAIPGSTLERRMRLERCIKVLEPPDWADTVAEAARALKDNDADGADEALLDFLPYSPEGAIDAVTEALFRLAARRGRVTALLVPALDDAAPARRAAAALIVGLAGTPQERERARALLEDADATVRVRAAHGLLAAGDKRAIPVLIALLKGDRIVAERAEGLLTALELKDAPEVSLEDQARCHAAWLAWWERNGAGLDLGGARAGLYLMDQHQLARRAAGDFFAGLSRGDPDLLRRSVDVPFYLAGNVLATKEAFDNLYASVLQSNKNTRTNFKVRIVRFLTPAAQARFCLNEGDRQHVLKMPAATTVIVHCVFSYQEGGQPVDLYSAVFVKVTAGGGRVTGFCSVDGKAIQ
jgi:hypothetical protein